MALSQQEIMELRKQIGYTPPTENTAVNEIAQWRQMATQYDTKQSEKNKPGFLQRVGSNIKSTFTQGANELINTAKDVYNKTENSNMGFGEKVLNYGKAAGNIAGTVAKTAGGIVGSAIEPTLPESVKQTIGNVGEYFDNKIKAIPGMTPEIQQALGDVFNTTSLLGAQKVEPAVKNTVESGIKATKKTVGAMKQATVEGVEQAGKQLPDVGKKAAKLLATEPSDQVKTILRETPTKTLDEFAEIARQAAADPRKASVFEKVGDTLTGAVKQLQEQTSSIGAQKSAILQKAKTGLQEFSVAPRKAILKVMKMDDNPLKNKVLEKLKSIKTKQEADKVIDDIQEMIYDATDTKLIAEGSRVERQLKAVIGEMNEELKKSLPTSYRRLNDKYAERIRILKPINRAMGEVVDGVPTRGASLIKQFFSPTGTKAKEFFDFIEKTTGIKVSQEATVAKFIGELFDDPKVKSLLEGIPTNRKGIIEKGIDIFADKTGIGAKIQKIIRDGALEKAKQITK